MLREFIWCQLIATFQALNNLLAIQMFMEFYWGKARSKREIAIDMYQVNLYQKKKKVIVANSFTEMLQLECLWHPRRLEVHQFYEN